MGVLGCSLLLARMRQLAAPLFLLSCARSLSHTGRRRHCHSKLAVPPAVSRSLASVADRQARRRHTLSTGDRPYPRSNPNRLPPLFADIVDVIQGPAASRQCLEAEMLASPAASPQNGTSKTPFPPPHPPFFAPGLDLLSPPLVSLCARRQSAADAAMPARRPHPLDQTRDRSSTASIHRGFLLLSSSPSSFRSPRPRSVRLRLAALVHR